MITAPIQNNEASKFIRSKPVMAGSAYAKLSSDAKALAFGVSGIEEFDILQKVRDTIATLPEGRNWSEVKDDVAEQLRQSFGEDEERVQRRAELLLRTHGFNAYRAGQWELAQLTKSLMPYFKYIATNDGKVRASHKALHGLVFPVDHKFWDTHTPPWDWGCRCQLVQISQADYDEQKALEERIPYENRRILDSDQEKILMTDGKLWTSPTSFIDAHPNTNAPKNTKSLHLPHEEILQRFKTPESKNEFLKRLEESELPEYTEKYTVRDFFEGKVVPELKSPEPRPITDAIRLETKDGRTRTALENASELIWRVHEGPKLPKIPLNNREILDEGHYDPNTGEIAISSKAENPIQTTLHEIGHFISHKAIGDRSKMAASSDKRLNRLMKTIGSTSAVGVMRLNFELGIDKEKNTYLLNKEELFARAYVQYILTKNGKGNEISKDRRQWPSKEFEVISVEFDKLFNGLNWRVSK